MKKHIVEEVQIGGYYRSYKYDPRKGVNDQVYQILFIGHEKDQKYIIYRPLYESFVFKQGKQMDVKKIELWFEPTKNGQMRYVLITDPEEIKKLNKILQKMYQEEAKKIPQKTVQIEL